MQLKHWKQGPTVFAELRSRGVSDDVAGMAARHSRRWWRMAGYAALHRALPNAYFTRLGVPRLAP
ncbi:MAG: hypothetical protein ACT4P6_21470 [Gemmatimonadaceae bacterium]